MRSTGTRSWVHEPARPRRRRPCPGRSIRRARLLSLPQILHRADQEPSHAPRLCARGDGDWVTQLAAIESVHVAAYIEQLQRARSAPTAKLRLAALRHLFDWMVIGQIMPTNPAAAVRGPRHIVRRSKTPVLDPAEARQLIDAIDTTTVIGLRDRALIGLMVYSFARIGAAISMRVEDVYALNRRLWVRLHEKGGKQHALLCHHNLESYLHEYIDGAGLASDPNALLFQTYSRATGRLNGNPLPALSK
jgi:site-specific recombinase XerC